MTGLKDLIISYIIKRGDNMAQKQLKAYIDGLLWLPTIDTVYVDGITRFRDSIVVHNATEKAKALLITGWRDMQEMIDIIDDNLNHYNYNKTENKWVGWSTNTQPETITLDKFLEDKEKTTLTDTITFSETGYVDIDLSETLSSDKNYLFNITFDTTDTTATGISYQFYKNITQVVQTLGDEEPQEEPGEEPEEPEEPEVIRTVISTTDCSDLDIAYYDIINSDNISGIGFNVTTIGDVKYTIDIYEL